MKYISNILRYSLNTVFFLAVLGAVAVYVLIHFGMAGQLTREKVTPLLCEKLQTKVEIGELEITWLNQLAINDVVIYDQQDDTLLYVRRAMVAYEMLPLLRKQLIINTVQLIEFDARITQASPDSDPNYQFIVEALAPRQDKRRKFINDLSLHSLHLRRGRLSYRLGNDKQLFPFSNYRNLQLDDITAAMQVEVSHITGIDVNVKRLRFREEAGLYLEGTGSLHNDSLHIQCRKLDIDYALPASVQLSGYADLCLSNLQEVSYALDIQQADITPVAIQRLSSIYGFTLPEMAELWRDSLEHIQVRGAGSGTGLHSVVFDGELATHGRIETLTRLSASYDLAREGKPLLVSADAFIRRFPYRQHIYHDIRGKVTTDGGKVEAQIVSNDPMLHFKGEALALLGKDQQHVTFDADLQHANPYALHYVAWSNMEGITLEGHVAGDLKFGKGDWPLGHAAIDSLLLSSATDTLCIDSIRLHLDSEGSQWVGNADAPFLQFAATKNSAEIHLPENEALANLLRLPFFLSQEATVSARWDSLAHHVTLEGNIPELVTSDGTINALFHADGSSELHSPMPVDLHSSVALDYITPKHLMSVAMVGDIHPKPLKVAINSAEISVDGHPFSARDALFAVDEKGVYTLDSLSLRNGEQELSISGSVAKDKEVQASLHANDLQFDFLLDMLGKGFLNFGGYASGDVYLSNDSVLKLTTEDLRIRDFSYMDCILGNNTLDATYDLSNRDLFIDVDIDRDGLHSYAGGAVLIGPPNVKSYIDISLNLDQLPIDFCDYWVGGFLHDLHGKGSGEARLFGRSDQLNIIGHPFVDANFTHSLLGARFNVCDTIHFVTGDSLSDGHIRLDHFRMTDRNGQTAWVEGDVKHRYLSDFDYNIDISLESSNKGFMVYDYPNQRPGEMYWGQLYANGSANLKGSTTTSQHQISVQMEPAGKSMLFLSPGEKNFSDNTYSFLKFQDKELLREQGGDLEKLSLVRTLNNNASEAEQETFVSADLQIHANQHCKVDMQLDPLAEDRLICTGSGDIALHYDTHNDLGLNGNYNISTGTYTITVKGDLMTKEFQLQPSSRVTFAGSPSDADLSLYATYNIPSANLRDLDESFSTVANMSRTTVPVDCKLYVSGSLSAPQISFDLEVKNAGDDIQTLVHNIIGTPEMLNREVFYLLLFGRFYTPEYATTTTTNNTGSGLSSFASAALASQLNNLLGHISDNFSLGTNFYSDKGDFSDMEMDLNLQTRLFSDRLLLSGNLSYRDPANRLGMQNNSNAFIGDFDVEYLFNPAGTLRAKAYSHYNERYYNINNALTTQGIGIVMRKDFKSFRNLLPWKKTKKQN